MVALRVAAKHTKNKHGRRHVTCTVYVCCVDLLCLKHAHQYSCTKTVQNRTQRHPSSGRCAVAMAANDLKDKDDKKEDDDSEADFDTVSNHLGKGRDAEAEARTDKTRNIHRSSPSKRNRISSKQASQSSDDDSNRDDRRGQRGRSSSRSYNEKQHYPEKGPLINMTKQKLPSIAKVLRKTIPKSKKLTPLDQKRHGGRIQGWYH